MMNLLYPWMYFDMGGGGEDPGGGGEEGGGEDGGVLEQPMLQAFQFGYCPVPV
jgi:hypothetical protein